MSLPMSDQEIVTSYKLAARPREQVKVLAELNVCSEREIMNVLQKQGFEVIKPPRRMPSKEDLTRRQELYDAGKTDDEIAEATGATRTAIIQWRCKRKLQPNVKGPVEELTQAAEAAPEFPPQYAGIEAMLDLFEQNKSSEIREAARTLVRKMYMQYVDSRLFPEEQKETPADGGV